MSAATVFGGGGTSSGLNVLEFSVLTFSIIYGWILVGEFQRTVESFFYSTLGMNSKSTIHSLIIFLTMFFLFIAVVWFIDELEIIPSAAGAEAISRETTGIVTATNPTSASNAIGQTLSNSNRTGIPLVISPVTYF